MPDPILVSHKGKLALLRDDGQLTTPDGTLLPNEIRKPIARKQKRWHDPYA